MAAVKKRHKTTQYLIILIIGQSSANFSRLCHYDVVPHVILKKYSRILIKPNKFIYKMMSTQRCELFTAFSFFLLTASNNVAKHRTASYACFEVFKISFEFLGIVPFKVGY